MKRREVITCSAARRSWPLAAQAQPGERMRRIGVLMGLAADDPESQARLAAFAQGLKQSGWTIGQNLRIDFRWGAGNAGNMRKFAGELVGLGPDVFWPIPAGGRTAAASKPHRSDRVHARPEPVGAGFVSSLGRPGGNATGFTNFEYAMGGKWLELLKEIAPA